MAKELNVYIEKNTENKRCDYKFYGANLKFRFGENNDISNEFLGKLTEDLSLFFIIFTTSWCCLTEYDIILPLILNKETTYEEVMNKYINSVKIDDNCHIIRITMENALDLNSNPVLYSIEGSINYETLIYKYRLSSEKELNSNPVLYSIEDSINYETLMDEYRLLSEKE